MSGSFPSLVSSNVTNLFTFGPELDRIDGNVTTLLANQESFFARFESQLTQFAAQTNQQLAMLGATISQMLVLLEAALIGFHSTATLANQQAQTDILNQILQALKLLQPQSFGVDTTLTATAPHMQPAKPGP